MHTPYALHWDVVKVIGSGNSKLLAEGFMATAPASLGRPVIYGHSCHSWHGWHSYRRSTAASSHHSCTSGLHTTATTAAPAVPSYLSQLQQSLQLSQLPDNWICVLNHYSSHHKYKYIPKKMPYGKDKVLIDSVKCWYSIILGSNPACHV